MKGRKKMIKSYLIYLITVIKSRYIREIFLKKNGLYATTDKFKNYGGKKLYSADDIQQYIYQEIKSGKPFMAGRFGSIEIVVPAKKILGIKYGFKENLKVLCSNAGFFPNDASLSNKYANVMLDSMKVCDFQGIWYLIFEDYFLKKHVNQKVKITEARYLEPWFSNNPWTKALEGKKVLVIHPFADSIKYQYENNREKLFQNTDYLPKFKLYTMKAVQTIADERDDRFDDWFEALDYMYFEAMSFDFDIALIGCGAYGYPLAAKLKKAGKQAIHLGGVLQIMFGVIGKRWEDDENPIVRNLFNEYWIRPSDNEIPSNSKSVEKGCYW